MERLDLLDPDAPAERPFGGAGLGGAALVLPPGDAGAPYAWSAAKETWLLVLEGTPVLRTADGEQPLRPGEIACLAAGPGGAHALTNPGPHEARVLRFGDRPAIDVRTFPDEGDRTEITQP